jgi:O-antigen/teichoic acid export membrane protein
MALTLIPISIQTLLTSAFANAYARDPNCLPRLIRSVYKMLILCCIPASLLGCLFVQRGIVVLYGESMAGAGSVGAAFCILHVLPLISMPLSMAVTAKEKVLQMLPYMIAQVAINLLLDWLLIPRWGMVGGVAAVTLTWLVTIPARILAVRRIVGNIPFPIAFLLRVAAVSAVCAGVLRWLWPEPGMVGLGVISGIFGVCFLGMTRLLRIVQPEDCSDLQGIVSGRLCKGIEWLAAGERPA